MRLFWKAFFLVGIALTLAIAAYADTLIDEAHFPDARFRSYVLDRIDTNSDGILSQAEAEAVGQIWITYSNITSLKGIELFPKLWDLRCYDNQLTSLDVSHNTALKKLACGYNNLTTLDISKNPLLTELTCYNNQLNRLDLSNNPELNTLSCQNNELTTLDVRNNTKLVTLECYWNQLSALDVSNNSLLRELLCYNNDLTALDLRNNPALVTLRCWDAHLTSLDVTQNTALKELKCGSNQLSTLDISHNTALEELLCEYNQLTVLNVSKNTALTLLRCQHNLLTQLNISKNPALRQLICNNTRLTTLDISDCPFLGRVYLEGEQTLKSDLGIPVIYYSIDPDNNISVNQDVTIIYNPTLNYTLAFNANGGGGAPSDQTCSSGEALTIPATIPTRFGYDFLGWGTSSGSASASYYPGGTITMTANRTLYAVWRSAAAIERPALPKDAAVNMNIAGAARYLRIVSQYSGQHVMETTGGYDTYGILYDSDGKQLASNDDSGDGANFRISYTLEAGKSYYLRVTMYSSQAAPGSITARLRAPSFTVTLDPNGGTVDPTSVTVTNFQFYGSLPSPERTAYRFEGWFNAASGGTPISGSTMVNLTADQTIYAHWIDPLPEYYTVSFDANGGSGAPASITAQIGTAIAIPSTVPTWANHTFKGWASSRTASSAQYQPGSNYGTGANATLYAVWEENSTLYDVTRDGYAFRNLGSSFGYSNPGTGASFPIPYHPVFTLIFGEGTNTSETMLRKAQADGWGGNCCGMASTSLLMYSGSPSTSSFGKSSVSALSVGDSNGSITVQTFIEAMQIAQYSNVFSKAYSDNKLKTAHFNKGGNMNALCQSVMSDVKNGKGTLIAIGKGRIGHALLACRVDKLSNTQSRMYVYDCNYPMEEHYIELQTDSQGNYTGWSYNMGDGYGIWGSSVANCFISCIPCDTISYIWNNRGNLSNNAELLSFEGDNLSIVNFDGEEIAAIEGGELVTDRNDIYELPVLSLTWTPVRNIYVPKQFFTVYSNDGAPLSLSVSDRMLGASVTTTAGAVSFSVDSSSRLNTVFVEDASPSETYTVTLESAFSGSEYSNVEVSGSGRGETVYISGDSGTLSISNCMIGSLIVDGEEKLACVITASAGAGGTISPRGDTRVPVGEAQTFAITPDAGYEIASVLVDGVSMDPVSAYTFDTVFKDHVIRATFKKQYEVLSAVVNASRNTMTVRLSNAGNARVLCALYAQDGQMLAESSVEVTANIGSVTLPFDTSKRTAGCAIRVMLVDAKWQPLCPRFEIRN